MALDAYIPNGKDKALEGGKLRGSKSYGLK